MLHDLQWKEEKDMDADDFILEGWDHVPNMEEVAALHDLEYRLKSMEKSAINRVQAFLDAKAKEYGYDHILSASSYVTSTFPKFKAEGTAFAKWRDDVWLYCYSVLAEWEAGTSKITTEDELIASLPEFKVTD
jgi:hypothetical protein